MTFVSADQSAGPVADGLPCPTCRAPLAGDQRYCLQCGTRRPEARLEFLDVLAEDAAPKVWPTPAPPAASLSAPQAAYVLPGLAAAPVAAAAAAPPARPGLRGWIDANGALLGFAGLLLGALLVGLLVGHWVTSGSSGPAAPRTQVVRVVGAGVAAGAAAGATDAGASSTAGGAAGTAKKAKKKAASSAGSSAPPKDAVSIDKASSQQIEKAAKRGKPISTGSGPPPPTDNKAPGGGSAFDTIG